MKKHGFIDVQFNGWMNVFFTEPGLTVDDVRKVTLEMLRQGTLAYCPTVVTGAEEIYERSFAVLAEAMEDPEIGPHLLGIHLEGPFISPLPGGRGAHPLKYIQAPSVKTFERYQRWAKGRIALLTVAPECDGAMELIRAAVSEGVVVSIGHHMADKTTVEQAVEAGATFCTHIGNGMPNEINRHKNAILIALAEDRLMGGFITDGHHLPPELIKVALRAKTASRSIITSDAIALGGMPPGVYYRFGLTAILEPSGRIYSDDTKNLVGSSSCMMQCMNYLASLNLLNEEELWQVGYYNPLALLGKDPSFFDTIPGPDIEFSEGKFRVSD